MVKAEELQDSDVKTTTINAAELYEGAYWSQQTSRHVLQLEQLWNRFEPISFQLHHAMEFGRLKSQFSQVAINDLLIAAIALSDQYTVLTRNSDDFIPLGVKVEDWEG
jgi:predicted nucleic acid-binding protein